MRASEHRGPCSTWTWPTSSRYWQSRAKIGLVIGINVVGFTSSCIHRPNTIKGEAPDDKTVQNNGLWGGAASCHDWGWLL